MRKFLPVGHAPRPQTAAHDDCLALPADRADLGHDLDRAVASDRRGTHPLVDRLSLLARRAGAAGLARVAAPMALAATQRLAAVARARAVPLLPELHVFPACQPLHCE